MSLMSLLETAQSGQLFSGVASATGVAEPQVRSAMAKLCPAIATALHEKAAKDDDLFQSLLDLIADNGAASPLDDADALTGSEAVSDGNAILNDVFGSRSAAMAALRAADTNLAEADLAKLAPIAATAVVGALAQSNKPVAPGLMEPQRAAGAASGQGFFGALIGAIIAGIVSALSRKLNASTRRRRTTTSYSRARTQRRRTTTRRQTAAVEDVFREILGNLGKR